MSMSMTSSVLYDDLLPDELLFQIFLRLPTKSIHRCRCVSKRWLSLLSDSNIASGFYSYPTPHPFSTLLFPLQDLQDVQDVPILLPYSCEEPPEHGKTCADLPAGFPIAKISIGDESRLVLTRSGRKLVRQVIFMLIKYVKRGEFFQKFEAKDIVVDHHFFQERVLKEPTKERREDDEPLTDLEEEDDDDEPTVEVGEDGQPICNLGEDDQKKYIEYMLSDIKSFFESVCGGESRVPRDVWHLLSLIESEAGNKGFLRNYYRLMFSHPSMTHVLEVESTMICLKGLFGLKNLNKVDEEAEKVLNTLDASCYPASWMDRVKMVSGSDTEYKYLKEVLDECKRRTVEVWGSEKADEMFSGVKGILIFLYDLTHHALAYFYSRKVSYPNARAQVSARHDMVYHSFHAVNFMFPNFFPGIFAAVYRSPTMRARLMYFFRIKGGDVIY